MVSGNRGFGAFEFLRLSAEETARKAVDVELLVWAAVHDRRESVATLERHLIGPSSQICRQSYQQTRLIAVEPPGNWRAALELGTDLGSRPGALNGKSKSWQNLDSKILRREHLV